MGKKAPFRIELPRWMKTREALRLLDVLGADGGAARFVGGCVRDAVLGRVAKDIDIATDLRPENVIALLAKARIKAIPTGLKHGTVTAILGLHKFEITTLRRDLETDGRRAKVAFTDDWKQDAKRRDFTLNALYADESGAVYDYVGGIKDARAGRIRFVGKPDARIAEDYLRILRLFRFYAAYGRKAPDEKTLRACKRHAKHIASLSSERVRDELLKLLIAEKSISSIKLMHKYNVLHQIIPGPFKLNILKRLVAFAPESDALLRLAVLVKGAELNADWAAERFKLSLPQKKRMDAVLRLVPQTPPLPDSAVWNKLVYFSGADSVRDALRLWVAFNKISAPQAKRALSALQKWKAKEFPITGQDVLALGIPPGKRVGELLAQTENWWIENSFSPNKAACLKRLQTLAQ